MKNMMRSLFIVATTFLTGSVAQTPAPAPSPGYPICYICGSASLQITVPDANITLTQGVSCGSLSFGGLNGFISAADCKFIQSSKGQKGIKDCKCANPNAPPTAPTPTSLPATTPTASPSAYPTATPPPCNICGAKGWRVNYENYESIVPVPGNPQTCNDLELLGLSGGIDEASCGALVELGTPTYCNCRLCRDRDNAPFPLDPLGANKTCAWLRAHKDQLIATTPGLVVDPSDVEGTWGDFACEEVERPLTGHDICVATCDGYCNSTRYCVDSPTATFTLGSAKSKRKAIKRNCRYLSSSVTPTRAYQYCKLYPAAAAACPNTCNTCA